MVIIDIKNAKIVLNKNIEKKDMKHMLVENLIIIMIVLK